MQSDKLIEINTEFWPKLKKKYLVDWPINSLGYDTVSNYINWKKTDPNFDDIHFYSLNDDWQDGTFLVLEGLQVFAFTLENSKEKLKRLLSLLPKQKNLLICGVEYRNLLAVYQVIEQKNWEIITIPSVPSVQSFKFYMSKEEAVNLKLDIPDGLTIKPLSLEDVEQINAVYSLRSDVSYAGLKKLKNFNLNLGLYDAQNCLLAWCLRYQLGLITALQTHEKYRRCGYASIVVKAMAIELANAGEDVNAAIVTTNISSIRLFKKLGFKCADDLLTWIQFKTS